MPTTPVKNLIYRAALPLLSPSPKGQMRHDANGEPLRFLQEYEAILIRHHVLGTTLLLRDGQRQAILHTSVSKPAHKAQENTLYRVASITKMATALVALRLQDEGMLPLDAPVATLFPDGESLGTITTRQLLSHTSGLRDTPAYSQALQRGEGWPWVLKQPGTIAEPPGASFTYCNFGFGLVGCVLEQVAGLSIDRLFDEKLFQPLGMTATLDASRLDPDRVMPITRVLPYRAGTDVTIPALGTKPLGAPDPLRHFGHTAGAMYTNAPSLARLLTLIEQQGKFEGKRLLPADAIRAMTTLHGFSGPAQRPTRRYGLGLVLLERPELSAHRLLGHQGFAYGCVDGAFVEESTGRQVIFLNGGSSEARTGKLGLVNRDILRWALRKEMPSWT